MRISTAADILDVDECYLKHFDVSDTFNSGNRLKGYICKKPDYRYGTLILYFVIGHYVNPQVVWGTPKINYPKVDETTGKTLWADTATSARIYEKIDGTNIIAYNYYWKLQRYTTYKTRLNPIAKSTKTHDFVRLCDNTLTPIRRYISEAINQNNLSSLAFEIYGNQHKHRITYPESLNIIMTFGIGRKNYYDIRSLPTIIDPQNITHNLVIPKARYVTEIHDRTQFDRKYRYFEELASKSQIETNGNIVGKEGFVWFVRHSDGYIIPYKCKPSIKELKAESTKISVSEIVSTYRQSFDAYRKASTLEIISILAKKFDEHIITSNLNAISKAVEIINYRADLAIKVRSIIGPVNGQISKNNMKLLSQRLSKQEIKTISKALM